MRKQMWHNGNELANPSKGNMEVLCTYFIIYFLSEPLENAPFPLNISVYSP